MTATADTIAICDPHAGAGGPGTAAFDEILGRAELSPRELRGQPSPGRSATHFETAGDAAC